MSKICFSYPAAAPAPPRDLRRMPYSCYSYPMMCFSYPDDVPRGGGDPGAAQPPPPGLRRMPQSCFRY